MPTVPYVKQTWTDGVSSASAARFGVIENGVYEAHLQPAVRVYKSTDFSHTSSGSWVAITFDTERFDQAAGAADTMHSTSSDTSRLTCRYAGVYMIGGNVQFAGAAGGTARGLRIFLNGATILARDFVPHGGSSSALDRSCTTLYSLAVSDYVELQAFQDSGGTLALTTVANFSPEFWMVRVA